MALMGNITWLLFGGIPAALGYLTGGLALCITIVGIPWGLMCFQLAIQVLMPFGKRVARRRRVTGCISTFSSLVWIVLAGWLLALMHLIFGAIFMVTVVGIPFGRQHFKLIAVALDPFGYELVDD